MTRDAVLGRPPAAPASLPRRRPTRSTGLPGPEGVGFGPRFVAATSFGSVLYLATAIGQPAMGRLADLIGPRRVYLFGTVSVAVGGLLGYLGWSLGSLIGLSFGHAATDAGLHRLTVILTVAAAGLLAATLADRKLATARPHVR
jgi:MFS family permease